MNVLSLESLWKWDDPEWEWHFNTPELRAEFLQNAPSLPLECVKSNEKRAVFRCGEYYLKIVFLNTASEKLRGRFFPSARSEFDSAREVCASGIACIDYLGWGRTRNLTMLITRNCANAENAYDYFYRNFVYQHLDSGKFFLDFEKFLCRFLESKLHHPDFHLGNLLYSEATGEFTLVDVHRVHRGAKLTHAERLKALHIILDLRTGTSPEKLLELFSACSTLPPDEAAMVLYQLLRDDVKRFQGEWERRKKQFLHGYSKFSCMWSDAERHLLIARDSLRRPLLDLQTLPNSLTRQNFHIIQLDFESALEQMLFSFYLHFIGIRHRRAVALDANGTLYFELLPGSTPSTRSDRERINGVNEYLLAFELNLSDYESWKVLPDGGLIISDFTAMLVSCKDRSVFHAEHVNPLRWKNSRNL